jgi:hypothetical protein
MEFKSGPVLAEMTQGDALGIPAHNTRTRLWSGPRQERIMKVTNINGTTDSDCKCGSWLEHWKKFGGQRLPMNCPERSCRNQPEAGAHVQLEGSTDSKWYIIPLCNAHGAETGKTLEVSDGMELASANVDETCGRTRR